jgi:hypothetical protein
LQTSEAGRGVAQWKCRTSANDVANADFTKRLEGTSLEAESILSSNQLDTDQDSSTPNWDWRKPTKRPSDHGSALSGTGWHQ